MTPDEFFKMREEQKRREARMTPKELKALNEARRRHQEKARDEALTSYALDLQREKKKAGRSCLLGISVADALGVPYEFLSRQEMGKKPVSDMVGYGTYNQPTGTWSDDSSMTFCLAESLVENGYDLANIASKFVAWKYKRYWTPRGELFDIGNTTSNAISKLKHILDSGNLQQLKEQKYYGTEYENGNGSLMRILPLIFYIKGKNIREQFDIVWEVSALTHRHVGAAMCCLVYLKLAEYIIDKKTKEDAYQNTRNVIATFWEEIDFPESEKRNFKSFIQNDVQALKYEELKSGGYVIESLESSLWCFLNGKNYKEVVFSAINLGEDTDTTAAIAGGLAGIYYGEAGIPSSWIDAIARKDDVINLGNQLGLYFYRESIKDKP